MVPRQNFNTAKVPRTTEVFPQAVIADNFIFISGTPGFDPAEAGSSMDKIVKTTVFMVSGNDFSILNKVYAAVFPENAPARSTPQVMPFPAGILISVECIALV